MDYEKFEDLVGKPVLRFIDDPLRFPIPTLTIRADEKEQTYVEVTVVNPGRGRKGKLPPYSWRV